MSSPRHADLAQRPVATVSDEAAAMRAGDLAVLESLQDKAADFAGWLHAKAGDRMVESSAEAAAEIRQLSHSFNRAARAVRQIMVLKQETAGLRALPGTRIVAAASNENAVPAPTPASARPPAGPRKEDNRTRDDLTDEERERARQQREWFDAQTELIRPALEADMIAAGRPDAAADSVMVMSRLVLSIPHPNLDECLKTLHPRYVLLLFKNENVTLTLGPGPPDAWAEYDRYAEYKQLGRSTPTHTPPAAPPSH